MLVSRSPYHDAVRSADWRVAVSARAPCLLSEIYHSVTGRFREEYYQRLAAILTIANISLLFRPPDDRQKYTRLSGGAQLVPLPSENRKMMKAGQITHRETAVGMRSTT